MAGASERDPLFFADPAEFRAWLAANHQEQRVLWVGYYRKDSGRPSITGVSPPGTPAAV